ncbi:hypothetical protein [Sphingobacterium sp. HMA12]|uniref:hypothetical protein n=1 Tax=Sphingobacterium sp. HMA12 TaxID=2050894 RepID=UPI000CE9F832|nr:hypothetical protein [Sphingobacterium sp. HMA12]
MKREIIVLALVPMLFFGCKKQKDDKSTEQSSEMIQVKFSTEGFQQKIEPRGSKASTITSGITAAGSEISNLQLLVYDLQNKLIVRKENISESSKQIDNTFTFEIPKGRYKIGLVGHNVNWSTMYFNINESNPLLHELSVGIHAFPDFPVNTYYFSDAFVYKYKEFNFQSDTTLSPLTLNRLTSKLEINIEDAIPEDIKFILVGGKINPILSPFTGITTNYNGKGYVVFDIGAEKLKTNTILATPIYPYLDKEDQPVQLEVLFFNSSYKQIGIKTIDKVVLKSNHITKLNGKLFSNTSNGNLTTNLSLDYSKDILIGSF